MYFSSQGVYFAAGVAIAVRKMTMESSFFTIAFLSDLPDLEVDFYFLLL